MVNDEVREGQGDETSINDTSQYRYLTKKGKPETMLQVRLCLPILIWMYVCFSKVESACYSNTNDILSTLRSASAQVAKEFVLCPATEFSIGSVTSDAVDGHHENDYTGGTAPLMARSNTHYKCGETGSSDNGCILKGGDVQFWSHEDTFDEDESLSVVVQGITFQDAQFVAILLENAGAITFIDCIIQVRPFNTIDDHFSGTLAVVTWPAVISDLSWYNESCLTHGRNNESP